MMASPILLRKSTPARSPVTSTQTENPLRSNPSATRKYEKYNHHYSDFAMSMIASQITILKIVYWPVNSPHKRPVTRKIFPFDDVIMY